MTDGGPKAVLTILRREFDWSDVAIALVGCSALLIGLFVHTTIVWILTGLVFVSAVGWIVTTINRTRPDAEDEAEEEHTSPTDGTMKKLLFDDFQAVDGSYVVKEVEEEAPIVPSTKSAQRVPFPLKEETVRELEILDFFDLDTDTTYAEAEPRGEFHSLLNKVLLVLKEVLFAHTTAFFWANREKGNLVVEAMATDATTFMEGRRLPFGADPLSTVALTGKPQILGRVNSLAEAELLRYYDAPAGVQSLVVVPVFYRNGANEVQPVGVLIGDSRAEDSFGGETIALLGRFTRLVSAMVKSYTDKYDLLLDSELLSSIRRLQDRMRSERSEATVLASLVDEASRLVNWDILAVTMYSEESHGWVVQKVVSKGTASAIEEGKSVDIAESVVGEVIRSNRLEVIQDLTAEDQSLYTTGDARERKGSFVCIPISSFNRCYGALTLESASPSNFSGSEVETLYRLVENAAGLLEVLYMNDIVREHVPVDQQTGVLTRKYFSRKVEEEVHRAEDFGTELALVSLAVDGLTELTHRYGAETPETVLTDLARLVRANVRGYDVIGRLESDRLGVVLVNTTASDAYLWTEKLRRIVAGHVISIGGKTFSVTFSAGVCGLTERMSAQEILSGTAQVLSKAIESGGNLVRMY